MDIWSGIEHQLRHESVTDVHNPRICTACHLDRYFSYRAERGQTGRMLALLALKPEHACSSRTAPRRLADNVLGGSPKLR
jgi:hypothetical protein